METKGSRKKKIVFAATALGIWVAFAGFYHWAMDNIAQSEPQCEEAVSESTSEAGEPSYTLTQPAPEEAMSINFGQDRGPKRDEMRWPVEGRLPAEISSMEVESTSLQGPRATIDDRFVHVSARRQGDAVTISACLDGYEMGGLRSGSYEGSIILTDPRFHSVSIPLTVTVQARYLMSIFLPGIFLVTAPLAVWMVWSKFSDKDSRLGAHALRAGMAAVLISAPIFLSQGWSVADWGGFASAAALAVSLYAAAAGAVVAYANESKVKADQSATQPNR